MHSEQLRWLAKKLPKRNNKWFAALEQSGLSACNFFYSLVIIQVAGIGQLGVYAFWFVTCQFMAMLTMGLATRQMVLEFSDKSAPERHDGLKATYIIVLLLQVALVALLGLMLVLNKPQDYFFVFWFALSFYCISFNLAELHRQFFYLTSRQRLSLWFSTFSLSVGALGFLIFALSKLVDTPELFAFFFLGIGNLIYVGFANAALKQRIPVGAKGTLSSMRLLHKYRQHGIPATAGMLITWMQNQSVTPLLMFMFGPLVVGYYSVAKMIVTPVNMVTTGLAKSALPQIRRAYGDGNHEELATAIRAHCRTSMRIVYCYVALVVLGWLLARYFGGLGSGETMIAIFIAAVIVMILSNYRFWISQNFVVKMQFNLLLRVGLVASCATVGMMLVAGLLFNAAVWVALAPAVGELILIYSLRRRLTTKTNEYSSSA